MTKFLIVFSIILLSFFSKAEFNVPSLSGPVVDQVGIFSSHEMTQLSAWLRKYHQSGKPQIQVLVTNSLAEESVEQVAIKVFDEWKIGSSINNLGILFLVAPNERKVRIEVGRGLEGTITDLRANRIIQQIVRPYFKKGQMSLGIIEGISAIVESIDADTTLPVEEVSDTRVESKGAFVIKLILLFIILFVFKFLGQFSGRGFGGGRFGHHTPYSGWGGNGGLGGGSFGSSGGGWSGGGGSSSGGGASGDW